MKQPSEQGQAIAPPGRAILIVAQRKAGTYAPSQECEPHHPWLVEEGVDDQGRADMAKFIQICASQDDLFALDVDGDVYQYNFTTKTWIKLIPSRSHEKVLSEQARPDRRNEP